MDARVIEPQTASRRCLGRSVELPGEGPLWKEHKAERAIV